MRSLFMLIMLGGIPLLLPAQKHDYQWLLGQRSQTNVIYSGTTIDFFTAPPDIYYEFRGMIFSQANASMCDSAGKLLFYTNGIYIANALHEPMENGAGLAAGPQGVLNQGLYGYILTQAAIGLPLPGHDSLYILLHADKHLTPNQASLQSSNLFFSKIDMTLQGGLGEVTVKNEPFLSDNLDMGRLMATRHANGRDWWLLPRSYSTNRYHRVMLHPGGLSVLGQQIVGQPIPSNSIGQATFSPDGTKYANVHLTGSAGDPIYVSIFDFDRCSGELGSPVQFTYADTAWAGGVAISPNSRFLYVSSFRYVYQYDLHASNVEASRITVAEWDGFHDPLHPALSTTFYLAQLGPDGKIYINSNNSTRYLHVINEPDSLGLACEVCQHCVELPSINVLSLPNFPHYRLHHLAGSPCDTLRQAPLAAWGYTDEGPLVAFRDSSYHDIRTWHWDFGDGATSMEAHPVHAYAASGVYEVCLAVNNPRGADTLCQMVPVVVTGTSEVGAGAALSVYPNPADDGVTVRWGKGHDQPGHVQVLDIYGRQIHQSAIAAGVSEQVVQLAGLPEGVYVFRIRLNGRDAVRKIVISR